MSLVNKQKTKILVLLFAVIFLFGGCAGLQVKLGELANLIVYLECTGIRGEPPSGVMSFDRIQSFGDKLKGVLLEYLTTSKARQRIAVLERDSKYLQGIIEEKHLQAADLVKKSIAIGEHEGAKYVISMEISQKGSLLCANIRLINCDTLRIELAKYLSLSSDNIDPILVEKFSKDFTKESLKVVKIR